MAQIADSEVKKALGNFEQVAGDGVAGPLLRPEQVDRILALRNESDPEVKGAKTQALIQDLLREAEESGRRVQELQRQLGLEEGQAHRFLTGERLSPEARQELSGALDGFARTALSEAEQEARRALNQSKGAKPPRPGRISV
jgi:hypothetical protein